MIPYHWLKNIGLAALVLIQLATVGLALRQLDSDQKTIERLNSDLAQRFEILGQIERCSHEAYALFVFDTADQLVTPGSLDAILTQQITLATTLKQHPQLTAAMTSVITDLKRLKIALAWYEEARHQFTSDSALLEQQIDNLFSSLFQQQMSLLFIAEQEENASYQQLATLDELTQVADATYQQIKASPVHQPAIIITLIHQLEQALDALQERRYPQCSLDDPSCVQMSVIRENCLRLRSNLPGIYHLWKYDPNLSYLQDEIAMISRSWDEIQVALNVLIQFEHQVLADESLRLAETTQVGRLKFSALSVLGLGAALAFSLLLSRVLHKRLDQIVIGIQEYSCGNHGYRLPTGANDHLGIIADEINSMADHLNASQHQLQAAHAQLEQRVIQRTEALQQANDRLVLMDQVFNNAREAIMVLNADHHILQVNPEFERLTGFTTPQIRGRRPALLTSGLSRKTTADGEEMLWEGELTLTDRQHQPIISWASVASFYNNQGERAGYIATFHDLRKLKQQQQQIRHQALHDALTGLPNRVLMADRLAINIAQAKRTGRKVGVLFLDLDNFKTINDRLGHAVGDKLLIAMAEVLSDTFRDDDTICRLGGDEFIILLGNITEPCSIYDLAERLLARLATPLEVDDHRLRISTSIGVAIYPDNGTTINELLKNADMAMYAAKEKGKNTLSTFSSAMDEELKQRLAMEEAIRHGLQEEQFEVFYQPQLSVDGRKLTGAEALVRWRHPEQGLVPPHQFIPLCEDTGLILPLGEQVLRSVFTYAATFCQQPGFEQCRLAVNVSPRQFSDPHLLEIIRSSLQTSGANPRNLEIEITESSMMLDVTRTRQVLDELQQLGLTIAIDDFGTGYSSLTQLKHFPIQTLKIDRSFIRDIPRDKEDMHLVETIVSMAHHLGIDLVAEGVETEVQQQFLAELGCQNLQGFLFSPPLPVAEFEQFTQNLGVEPSPTP